MSHLQKVYPDLPVSIETDVGKATLGVIIPRNAVKEYTCPLCDELIEIGEGHVLAVPVLAQGLRRHLHAECLKLHLQFNVSVKLHPKEPNALHYHL